MDAAEARTLRWPWLVLAVVMILPWLSAWDHPLHAPDEGRYGSVSGEMAARGEWVVPHFRGAPHLTKPPLIYWLQGGAIKLIGRSELALRLPSLVAGSLTLLVLFLFVGRMRGRAMAGVAVGLCGVMPLPLFFARVAAIDGVLALFWLTALVSAALAIDARRNDRTTAVAWLALAWGAVALAALAKGPVAPAPMVIVATWLALARRWHELRWFTMHALWGVVVALAPIAAWAGVIIDRFPESLDVWREQFIDRFSRGLPAQPLMDTGGGATTAAEEPDLAEPIWFYAPVFLAGMLPATCALTLPWFNMRLREALRAFTLGDLRALMLVAVVGPLLFFSAAKGKMPAYIVPTAAPLAVLVAGMLMRVGALRSRRSGAARPHAAREARAAPLRDEPLEIPRDPDVRLTFAATMTLGLLGAGIAGAILGGSDGMSEVLVFTPVPALAIVAALMWPRNERGRRGAILLQWIAMLVFVLAAYRLEHRALIRRDMGARSMVERVQRATGTERPQIVIYNFRNPTIDYYADSVPLMVWSVSDLRALWPRLRSDHAVLVPLPTWQWIEREFPRLAEAFEPMEAGREGDARAGGGGGRIDLWNRWPGKPTAILRMVKPAEEDAWRDPGSIPPEPHE